MKPFQLITILIVSFIAAATNSYGQSVNDFDPSKITTRKTYIGIGTGLNSVGVIGVSAEQNLGKISVIGTAGLGSWGYKFCGGARYYFSYPFGKAIGMSYALATGHSKVRLDLETLSGTKQYVNVQLSPVHLINFSFFNSWKLGNRSSRFGLEIGYSVIINSGDNFKVLDSGVTLSSTSFKALRIFQPGGLIIGVSFAFGR